MSDKHRNGTRWHSDLEELKSTGLFRTMPEIGGFPGSMITVDGYEALNFSGNNYLGLASHPQVIEAAIDCLRHYGVGATASRLIAGNWEIHRELESRIAHWKRTESALVFGSGYQANVGILTSLTDRDDAIFSDELNHASIIDGCRLSRAKVKVFPHLDLARLEEMLRKSGAQRKLVVTETVFSMDGDRAPLGELDDLCRKHDALLMVDEAHATGLLGPEGQGLVAEAGIEPAVQMGTLGKAVGVAGAYVAGSNALTELLRNRARSLIYSTAPPAVVMGASLKAIDIIASDEGDRLRVDLHRNCSTFHRLLSSRFEHKNPPSHIVPFHIGDSELAMAVSRELLKRGVFAHGIRYPTVARGSERLRFTLMSSHTEEDLTRAVTTLQEVLEDLAPFNRGRGVPHPAWKNGDPRE